ncbi:MAG: hypothetical protein GY751_26670, partial [Bacteroidetes bacterium]|nr:hypothetical protein [Bacteroidota bacterium]
RKDLDRPLEVYPKVGVIGKELNVTLTGSGDFDKNTAISMSLDTGNRKAIIGSSATPGAAPGLTVVCGEDDKVYAYAVYGDLNGYKGGLQITDMSNPKKPEVIASVATGFAFDVVVKQDTAYVAHGDNKSSGLKIIDISNPAKPQVTGSVTTPGYAIDDSVNKPFFGIGITVNNDMVYLADGSAGLQIIDTGNPSNPEIIASLDTAGFASGITLNGNTAYMADGSGGLKIIDISDPLHPEMISSVHTSKDANGVTFFESELYVVCGNLDDCIGTLAIIDVSDPKTPEVTASVNIPGTPRNVTLTSNTEYAADKIFTTTTAYIADGNGGLQVIDMTDPSNAFVNFYVDISGYANGIAIIKNMPYKEEGITVTRDTAYVSHGELDNSKGGLEIIDLSKPLYLNEMGFYVTPAPANGIAVIGNTAYLVYRDWDTHTGGLRIIDVNNPSKPATVGSADIPNKAYDIAVKGDIAYVACHGCGLQIIDISDPGNPDIIGSAHFPHNNSARSIALNEEGNMAYIATGGEKVGTLQIIKVSDPENPVVESYMDLPNEADKIAVNGNTVYVTYCAGNILNKSGLLIIDVSDPSNPVEISSIEAPSGEVEIDVGLFPIKETIYTKLKGIAADNEKNTLYALYSGLPEDVQIGDLLSDLQVGDLPPELQSILKLYLGVSEDVYIRDLEIDLQIEVLSSELQSEGLQIIDVSNPSQPDVVNSVKIEGADFGEEITVSGDVVYAVYGSMGLGDNR